MLVRYSSGINSINHFLPVCKSHNIKESLLLPTEVNLLLGRHNNNIKGFISKFVELSEKELLKKVSMFRENFGLSFFSFFFFFYFLMFC